MAESSSCSPETITILLISYDSESVGRSVVSILFDLMDCSLPGSSWIIPCMEFSRQEYWSGLPFPSPGDFPNPGIEPGFPAL